MIKKKEVKLFSKPRNRNPYQYQFDTIKRTLDGYKIIFADVGERFNRINRKLEELEKEVRECQIKVMKK